MYPDECDSAKARICRRSMGKKLETRKTVENSTQMTAAKNIPRRSSTTSKYSTWYLIKIRAGKIEMAIKLNNVPKKRLSGIVDRAVREKVTKGRAGITLDSMVKKIWKDLGGNKEEVMSAEKLGQGRSRKKTEKRERLTLRNQVESEKHLRDIRGIEGRNGNENASARPNGLGEKAETAYSCR